MKRFFVSLAVGCLLASVCGAELVEELKVFQGAPVASADILFDGKLFTVPGQGAIPRNDVQMVEFRDGAEKAASAQAAGVAELSALAKAQLEKSGAVAQAYPGSSGIVLVDDGEFVYHKNGTNLYRYHFAGLVLKEEKKEWAQITAGFDEGRSRVRILFARSVSRDGTVTELDPNSMEVSSPSEELAFFNPTHKLLSGVIPGVEVGSVVEYGYEYENYNPEDPRLFSPGFFFQGTEPVTFSRIRVDVPADVKFHYMTRNFADADKAEPVVERTKDTVSYVWQVEDVAPITPEPLMPAEPNALPVMEGSIFKDMNEVFGMLRDLQLARVQLTPAIEAKVKDITDGAQDTEEKIARLYHWVQTNTRYISIKGSLGAGFSGHTANETFENRYGDCTDKAMLFATMLKAIGVESYPIIVKTNDAGTATVEIPAMDGNHCINEVCLDGRSFYLDCTAQDYRYPYFRDDDHGVYALNAIRGDLKVIPVPPASENQRVSKLEVALSPDGDAVVKTKNTYNGTVEAMIRGNWKRTREDNRGPMMAQYVNSISPGAILDDFTMTPLDDLAVPLEMTLNYSLPGLGVRAKDLMYLRMPTLDRDYPEAGLPERQFAIQYPTTEERMLEIDLMLPDGFKAKWLPPALTINNKYLDYSAAYEERDGHVVLNETFRRLERIVPPADYAEYRDALNKITSFTKQEIFLTEKD